MGCLHFLCFDSYFRLFGDRDLLLRLLLDSELSRLLCSRSRLGAFNELEGVPVRLDVADIEADTKSMASLGALDFRCSFSFKMFFCDAFNSSAYAHCGKVVGTETSSDRVDAYCSSSLTFANANNLCRWVGSRSTEEPSSR